MKASELAPDEVARVLGTKHRVMTVESASILIRFIRARELKDHHVHGAEREFDEMREELGRVFPDPIERIQIVDEYEQLFG